MAIAFFVLGLFAGSFVNCVVYRIESDKSFVGGRSFCPKCGKTLSWFDLIPLLGFIALKGKCRYCKQKISAHYPIVEFVVGLFFWFFYANVSITLSLLPVFDIFLSLSIFSLLAIIFIYDLKHYLIPDKIIYPAIVFSLARIIFLFPINQSFFGNILPYLLSGVGASFFFFIIFWMSRGRWIGFGDVKLALLMGIFLGFPNILVAFFLSFFIGAIMGIVLIVTRKKGMKSEIPFAPFLISGLISSFFWGEKILSWYLSFLNV